ncbi:MAG: acetyl-CoA hydrolase/transferase C-terminal domain-containing protein [Candidatus Nanopelagicales bacterium]
MTVIANAEALAAVLQALPPNPRVVVSGNFASPFTTMALFDQHVAEWRLWALNPQKGLPSREGIIPETPFVGPGMRRNPRLRYVPCRLSLVPALFASAMVPDVVVIHTSSPHQGVVSLGIEVNVMPAAIEACRARGGKVIAQANPRMPFTYGDAVVPLSSIDVLFEAEEPVLSASPIQLDDTARFIGERIAARIKDGSTLQMGIGAVPDAVLNALQDRKGLRFWTEMFSDGVLALDRAGALDPDTPLAASFLFGSEDLYRWVDGNHRVAMVRTERTNDPGLIAKQPMMTSVNAALQVDLFAQANASRIKARIYSGIGGQTDFIVGALHAPGGQAFIALRSWHPKANVSTIVPLLDEPVTSIQHTAVVTENGLAEIWGRSQDEQADNLINKAAHPDVREELREEAEELGLHVS